MVLLVYQLLRPRIGVGLTLVCITVLSLAVAWMITYTVDRPARKPVANLLYRCAAILRIHKPALSNPTR
jgi:peptidoglycan/LPS O-acetylase OafA/YrhL